MHRSLKGADGLSPIWKLVFLPKALVQESKARFRRRTCTFHEPSLIHWINDLKSSASESIRNTGFNLEHSRPKLSVWVFSLLKSQWIGKITTQQTKTSKVNTLSCILLNILASIYRFESFTWFPIQILYIHGHFKLYNMKLLVLMIKLTHWAWAACVWNGSAILSA